MYSSSDHTVFVLKICDLNDLDLSNQLSAVKLQGSIPDKNLH